MVTGDNLITARSIAKKCGILPDTNGEDQGGHILEGKTFHKLVHDDDGEVSSYSFIKNIVAPSPNMSFNLNITSCGLFSQ